MYIMIVKSFWLYYPPSLSLNGHSMKNVLNHEHRIASPLFWNSETRIRRCWRIVDYIPMLRWRKLFVSFQRFYLDQEWTMFNVMLWSRLFIKGPSHPSCILVILKHMKSRLVKLVTNKVTFIPWRFVLSDLFKRFPLRCARPCLREKKKLSKARGTRRKLEHCTADTDKQRQITILFKFKFYQTSNLNK